MKNKNFYLGYNFLVYAFVQEQNSTTSYDKKLIALGATNWEKISVS
jgi:spore coat polysaccharide biosynthesis predicted glycosyltransferase SpsG